MERQDYAFQPALTVGELKEMKDWHAINQCFVKELMGTIESKVLKALPNSRLSLDAFLSMLGACVAHASSLN